MRIIFSQVCYLLILILAIAGCNGEPSNDKDKGNTPSTEEKKNPKEIPESTDSESGKTMYVYAEGGLNFRVGPDLSSNVIEVIPFGSKIKMIKPPAKKDMNVEGFQGGMAKVEFNGKTGFAFSGFLCRYPTPQEGMKTEEFVDLINNSGMKAKLHEDRLDDEGYIQDTKGMIINCNSFQEAFLIARVYYNIPESIQLPKPSKDEATTVKNKEPDPNIWSDEMILSRNPDGSIKDIYYYLRGEGWGQTIIIERAEGGIKIAEVQIVD